MESLLWVGDEFAFFEVLHLAQCLDMSNEYAKTYSVEKISLILDFSSLWNCMPTSAATR